MKARFTGLDAEELIARIRRGVEYSVVAQLQIAMDLSVGELSWLVDIAPRTLSRRKNEGKLSKDESERAVRIRRLWERALEVFEGDAVRAREWFRTPVFSLGEKSPLEFSDTEPGAQEVLALLGRIEHGLGA